MTYFSYIVMGYNDFDHDYARCKWHFILRVPFQYLDACYTKQCSEATLLVKTIHLGDRFANTIKSRNFTICMKWYQKPKFGNVDTE